MSRSLLRRASTYLAASVAAVALGFISTPAHAAVSTILDYSVPAAWNGTGTAVTDQSTVHNNGTVQGTPTLATDLPAGKSGNSLTTNLGGFQSTAVGLLSNTAVAGAGGYGMDVYFKWDGTAPSNVNWTSEKILDYSGTDGLELVNWNTTAGTADLKYTVNDPTDGVSLPIVANTWYHAQAIFNTQGNPVAGDGSLPGLATLIATPDGGSAASTSASTTKVDQFTNRSIAVGILGLPGTHLVLFNGDIYNPSVSLGVVPEPATLGLLGIAGLGLLRRRRGA